MSAPAGNLPAMVTLRMDQLRRAFDDGSIQRGRAYAERGHVLDVQVGSGGAMTIVMGEVEGTARRPYVAQVVLDRSGHIVSSRCSCPVGYECKHSVAVLFAASEGEGSQAAKHSTWARDLSEVLTGLEQRSQGQHALVPLALEIGYKPAMSRWAQAPYTLPVRPLRRGKRDNWVKTGASWYDVQGSMRYARDLDPAQVEALVGLSLVLMRGYASQDPNLLAHGPMIWPLLRQARDVGVALVPGSGLNEIRVVDESLEVIADLMATGPDLALRIGLMHEGVWWPNATGELATIGDPAHGVALLGVGDGRGGRTLVLAPLREPLVAPVRARLPESEPVLVPSAERAQFESEYLPRLRRQLRTGSSDGSVDLPEIAPPRLACRVQWSPRPVVTTSWVWSYRQGEQIRTYAVDALDGFMDTRDAEAEKACLAELELPENLAIALSVGGDFTDTRVWTDRALVSFVEELLPSLREAADAGQFDLVESGDPRDFRAAQEDPQITVSAGEGEGDRDWLDLSVIITVEGEQVPLASVVTGLTTGQELIFTESGRHLPAAHPAFAQLADLVADAGEIVDQPREGLRVGRYDLAFWAELEQLGVVDEQAQQWARTAAALREFEGLPELEPTGLASIPRPYQSEGIRWLGFLWEQGLGGILADDMGLGKTLQTLAMIAHARANGAAPFLVIAPTSVIGTWVSETGRHVPGLVARAVMSSASRREESLAALHAGADIVVTSYTLFRLEAEAYRELEWGGLILDEAHTVKNHQGKTYQEVRRLEVPFRLALTGTPFENRLMELWALLSIVAPGLYPWPKRFTEHVVKPVEHQGDDVALARFRRRIRPFLLRRTKELVAADLPPKQEQIVEVELSPRHRRIYDTHLQRERQTVLGLVDDFERNRIAIFGALTRLRQLSLDPALIDDKHEKVGSAKLDALVEHLHELAAEGHRALVFSQFTSYLRRVQARLTKEGIATVYLDGRTRNRPAVIESFKTGDQPVFLISLKAGGSGLTLTEADYVFVLDPWWNPAVEAQAIDRVHRIGQQQHVMAYRLVSKGTIEEKVMALKEAKAALFAQVLDGDGAMAKALDAEDVRALFEE